PRWSCTSIGSGIPTSRGGGARSLSASLQVCPPTGWRFGCVVPAAVGQHAPSHTPPSESLKLTTRSPLRNIYAVASTQYFGGCSRRHAGRRDRIRHGCSGSSLL